MVLIESDWNLKRNADGLLADTAGSINRIRLEFKVDLARVIVSTNSFCSINRIRLEFKDCSLLSAPSSLCCINRIRLEFKGARADVV